MVFLCPACCLLLGERAPRLCVRGQSVVVAARSVTGCGFGRSKIAENVQLHSTRITMGRRHGPKLLCAFVYAKGCLHKTLFEHPLRCPVLFILDALLQLLPNGSARTRVTCPVCQIACEALQQQQQPPKTNLPILGSPLFHECFDIRQGVISRQKRPLRHLIRIFRQALQDIFRLVTRARAATRMAVNSKHDSS